MDIQPDRYMSASDLASTLTRMELAMVRTLEAFSRWTTSLHRTVDGTPLGAQDVWLLHAIRMRGGPQNLSELLLFLNRNDVSTIQYSLRKIEQYGLIERVTGNSKREAGYRLTPKGLEATSDYAQVREDMLVHLLQDMSVFVETLDIVAASLERMTGFYDQSTQLVLNRKILGI